MSVLFYEESDMLNATYTKLTTTGEWGLRIEGTVSEGDVVLAVTKGGQKSRKLVTRVVWTGNGITLCEFGNAPKAAKEAPKPIPAYQPDLEAEMANAEADLPY